MSPFIASLLKDQLKFPERLINVATAYLLMIILPAHKHSQTAAAKLSKLHRSQFSRLLGKPTALAKDTMLQLSQRVAAMMAPTRKPLFSGAPWTLALIIDSTLHQRSSLQASSRSPSKVQSLLQKLQTVPLAVHQKLVKTEPPKNIFQNMSKAVKTHRKPSKVAKTLAARRKKSGFSRQSPVLRLYQNLSRASSFK